MTRIDPKIGRSLSSTVWQACNLQNFPCHYSTCTSVGLIGPRFRVAKLGGGSLVLASVAGSTSYDNR